MPCHVLGDRGLPNVDAELEEFSMDPGSAPQRVSQAHAAPSVDIATSIARTNDNQQRRSASVTFVHRTEFQSTLARDERLACGRFGIIFGPEPIAVVR